MRFSLHPKSGRYLYKYSLREDDSGEVMTDHLHYIFLEVTKCSPDADAPLIERVGYALNHMAEFTERPEGFEGELFDLLFNSADFHTFAPKEKIKYHNDMTTERDIRNQIQFAHDKGVSEGKAEGLAAVAARMKAKDMEVKDISELTGLTTDQIEAL